jgi:two-component system, NtrC family, nitrogen regulation sensor histidine kinase NtrY
LRAQRQDLYQRELLLDTVIQASPLALLLTNANGTILYGNLAARQLLGGGRKLEGLRSAPLLEAAAGSLREALEGPATGYSLRRSAAKCRCSTSRTDSSC